LSIPKSGLIIVEDVTEDLSSLFQLNWITYLRDTGIWQNDKGRTRRSRSDKQSDKLSMAVFTASAGRWKREKSRGYGNIRTVETQR
jgi:hypothetical protein